MALSRYGLVIWFNCQAADSGAACSDQCLVAPRIIFDEAAPAQFFTAQPEHGTTPCILSGGIGKSQKAGDEVWV
jgi:hypothetical protein